MEQTVRRPWRAAGLLMLALALALGGLITPAQAQPGGPSVQEQLLEMAADAPRQPVGVIVQVSGDGAQARRAVDRLGGTVTRSFTIINAFAATLPAGAVRQLAGQPGVTRVSYDAPVKADTTVCAECVNTYNLVNPYNLVVRADQVWNSAPYLTGEGVTVAVIDSGISDHGDFDSTAGGSRIVGEVNHNSATTGTDDHYGHGTHVAGIIAGDGRISDGMYIGIAPEANLLNVRISNNIGAATGADLLAGMEWVLANREAYNIRVANLSLNSVVEEHYLHSPLSAAVEILWFNGIVVVSSAGNTGAGAIFPPANDPFVITVGAWNDNGTVPMYDDSLARFSARGVTRAGHNKPDIVAPGSNIIAPLANPGVTLARNPERVLQGSDQQGQPQYLRLSGTSMAAPMVAGAAALLLQDEPHLTPDQVKHRLLNTARWQKSPGAGFGLLDIHAAVTAQSLDSANTGLQVSSLLGTGSEPLNWDSVSWNSVSWNSVSWNSVSWNSVSWNSSDPSVFFNVVNEAEPPALTDQRQAKEQELHGEQHGQQPGRPVR